MKRNCFKPAAAIAAALLFCLFATPLFAQDAEWTYNQRIEKATLDRQNRKYKDAANAATQAFYLAGKLDNPREAGNAAIELSISANAAARNSGVEFKGPWSLLILKESRQLLLLEKGTICRRFEVSSGEDFSTPPGGFKVGAKLGYPNYELNGTLYKTNAPGNTLGSRWIELRNPDGVPVSGITGKSMTKQENPDEPLFFSLKNADINEIFGLLAEGSDVKVK